MNAGDVKLHVGIVKTGWADMTISALVPALAGETVIDDIGPEYVTPVRWRPSEFDLVVIYQRMGALRPSYALTWGGWKYSENNNVRVPKYLQPGMVHLQGETNRTSIVLDDETSPQNDDVRGSVRIGRFDADEPLLLGNVYKDWMEAVTQQLIDLAASVKAVNDALVSHTHVYDRATATGPGVGTTYAPTASASPNNAATYTAESGNAQTVNSELTTKKGEIPDHLSKYVFTSDVPDPDPPDGIGD